MKKQTFNILSLDGGGYKGLFTASLLNTLENKFSRSCFEVFDLFAGTSTGSIIALALAIDKSAKEIKEMYENIGSKIFSNKRLPLFFSLYKNSVLNSQLKEFYQNKTLEDVFKLGKKVIVPAVNLTNKTTKIFKTDHANRLNQHNKYKLADIATASSSAPCYFSSFKIKRPDENVYEHFADGGLFANNPSACAVVEAIKILNIPKEDIRIISIGTSKRYANEHEYKIKNTIFDWKLDLIKVPLETTSQIHNWITDFVMEEKHLRVEPSPVINKISMDDISEKTKATLINEGIDTANTICKSPIIEEIFVQKEEKVGQ